MKRVLVALRILLCATVCTSLLSAQSSDWEGVKRLSSGRQVKIVLGNGTSYKGHVRSVDENSLALESGRIAVKQEIKRVLIKTGGHRGKHALIGGAIGAAAGLGVGAGIDSGCNRSSFTICTGNLGKAVLTPAFGLIGLGIGALLPAGGWQEIYRCN
jgi:hypothetical protein